MENKQQRDINVWVFEESTSDHLFEGLKSYKIYALVSKQTRVVKMYFLFALILGSVTAIVYIAT